MSSVYYIYDIYYIIYIYLFIYFLSEPHILLFRRPLPKNWSGTFLPVNIPWYSLNTRSPTSYIVCCAWSCICLSNQAQSDCTEDVNVLSLWHLMNIIHHQYVATSTTLIPKCLRWISTLWSSVEIKYWVTCYWHNMLFFLSLEYNCCITFPNGCMCSLFYD